MFEVCSESLFSRLFKKVKCGDLWRETLLKRDNDTTDDYTKKKVSSAYKKLDEYGLLAIQEKNIPKILGPYKEKLLFISRCHALLAENHYTDYDDLVDKRTIDERKAKIRAKIKYPSNIMRGFRNGK